MTNSPLITISILNRNGLDRLKKCLPSILNQTYPNVEILVVDNGSTDKSLEYVSGFEQIRVIKNGKNLGVSKARNIAVENARGEYVLMLDNDIQLSEKNFLEVMLGDYLTAENPAFLSPLVIDDKAESTRNIALYFNRIQMKEIKVSQLYKKGCHRIPGFQGGVFFFRKDIFIKLGGFDEIYMFNIDDYDMSARAHLYGYRNYLTGNVLAVHHGIDTRNNAESISWKQRTYLCGFSRMIWKNYSLKNALIWWPISALWIFCKVLKSSIKHHSFFPIISYTESFHQFLKDFPSTLEQRKKIQTQRLVKKDEFLKIGKILIKNK